MIARLTGTVEEKGDEGLVVDVQGVGYQVHMSLLALARAPREGEPVKLRVQTVVREDAFELFGFLDEGEERLFELLTSVSRVGPRMAIGVLGGIDAAELAEALAQGNVARLKGIKGVGKTTAERLVVELKSKVAGLSLGGARGAVPNVERPAGIASDLVSALCNLGYKPAQAERLAQVAQTQLGERAPIEALLKEALKAART